MIPESGFCEIIPKAKDQLCKSQQKPPKDPLCIVPGDQNLKWLWGGWSGWEYRPLTIIPGSQYVISRLWGKSGGLVRLKPPSLDVFGRSWEVKQFKNLGFRKVWGGLVRLGAPSPEEV